MENARVDPKAKQKGPPPITNTVRMDLEKLNSLFDDMERRNPNGQKDPRRAHVRWAFRQIAVQVRICHAAGSQATFHVACRNISSGGMSILHSSFLHTGTRVVATLPHISGHTIEVDGTVARCVHIQGICHEIGIKFRNPVDARNFVKLDLFEDGFVLEKVEPESLEGVIVYLASSAMEESLVRHFLRETKLRLRVAESFEEAKKLLEEPAGLLLADHIIKGKNSADFVSTLREQGQMLPVILLASDTSDATREQMIKAEVSTFLAKPLDQNTFFRALAEFMIGGKDTSGTVSSLPSNHPNTPMVENFVKEVHAHADEIEKSIKSMNFEHTRNVVMQIAGVAPIMGFPKLALIAQAADRALSSSMSLDEAKPQLRQLVRMCREIRRKAA